MNKITQNIFSKTYVDALGTAITNGNIDNYLKDEPFNSKGNIPVGKSVFEISQDFQLLMPDDENGYYDTENAIILYKEFQTLNETQASDSRLWVYLTHVTLWKYMRKRWPLEKFNDDSELASEKGNTDKKIRYIFLALSSPDIK